MPLGYDPIQRINANKTNGELFGGKYSAIFYVDASAGDDTTARKNDCRMQYSTVNGAANAAYTYFNRTLITPLVYVTRGTFEENTISRNGVHYHFQDNTIVWHGTVSIFNDLHSSMAVNGTFSVFGKGTFACLNNNPGADQTAVNLRYTSNVYIQAKDIGDIQLFSAENTIVVEDALIRWNVIAGNATQHLTFRNCTLTHPLKLDSFGDAGNRNFKFEHCKFRLLSDYTNPVLNELWNVYDTYNDASLIYLDAGNQVANSQANAADNNALIAAYSPQDFGFRYVACVESYVTGLSDSEDFIFNTCEFHIERETALGLLLLQNGASSDTMAMFNNCTVLDKTTNKDTTALIFGGTGVATPFRVGFAGGLIHDCSAGRKSYAAYSDINFMQNAIDNSIG